LIEGKNKAGASWVQELDYLRGFAILAVIVIHTVANFTNFNAPGKLAVANMFINLYAHFAVPLFIFISGFVLTFKYKQKYDIKQFYKLRALTVIPQYLFFSIIYLLYFNRGNLPPLSDVLDRLLTARAAYHMWFFVLIIQLYILYPVLAKLYFHFEKINRTGMLLAASWLLQIGFNVFYMHSGTALTNFFITHIFYFTLGMYVCRNYKTISQRVETIRLQILFPASLLLTAAETAVWLLEASRHSRFVLSLLVAGGVITETILFTLVFTLLYKISFHMSKRKDVFSLLLKEFGRNSYGIFLMHVLFLEETAGFLWKVSIYCDRWVFFPILFCCTAIFSFLSANLLGRVPYIRYLITGKM
jgi:surface polysaccharide O-acyltransferase-like enzyme